MRTELTYMEGDAFKVIEQILKGNTNFDGKIEKSKKRLKVFSGYGHIRFKIQKFSKENNLATSLPNPGSSLDNATCETFFSWLKIECKQVLVQNEMKDLQKTLDNYINYYKFEKIRLKTQNPPADAYLDLQKKHSNYEMLNF